MELNWLQSLVFGLMSGFCEFLPVSSGAHDLLFQRITGTGGENGLLRLLCRAAVLLALLLACRPRLAKLRRERKLAAIPPKRRKRQPDPRALLDIRLLRSALIPVVFGAALYIPLRVYVPELWLLALLLGLNGWILYLPERLPQGNKDSRSLSALDALLLGTGSILTAVPGLSGIGCAVSFGKMRGADSSYILDICLLLAIPVLTLLLLINGYFVLAAGAAYSTALVLKSLLCAAAAFAGAYYGIVLMRFLAVKVGFSGFAYYCWGAGLFTFILYLML